MSIDSVSQSAASAYITQQTGANALADKAALNTGFQRMVNDVVEISDEAKAAYGASGNSNPRGSLLTAWLNSTTGKADLSMLQGMPDGVKMNLDGYSTFTEMMDARAKLEGFDSFAESREHYKLKGAYGEAKGDFDTVQARAAGAIWEKIHNKGYELAGSYDFSIQHTSSTFIISNPITGVPYPLTNAETSFLKEAKAALDQVTKNRPQFPSFDEWKLENKP